MLWLGMCSLGVFIGCVITYGLTKITDWSKPGNVFSAIISSAIAGGVFTFIKFLDKNGTAVSLYPVGLAYGMLCINLRWVTDQDRGWFILALKIAHVVAFIVASILLLFIFLWPDFRNILPPLETAQAK